MRKTQAERREEIIDAALELLGEYGLEGTTVSRIADAVGLTPGALYRHFESRNAILAAANAAAARQALSWLDTSRAPEVLRRLEELKETHAAWTKNHLSTIVRPFFQALSFSQQADLAGEMTLERILLYGLLVEMADEGKRQGSIRPDVESADVAWTMLMFIWIEDIALMLDAEEAITGGVFSRNFHRMLESFRPRSTADPSVGELSCLALPPPSIAVGPPAVTGAMGTPHGR
ncbi:MAG: TetR/AcrR family transcriptional regulator [Actinobacteria bacterium]|nr:TetR/AcrR family transcriptional regulator [Actinomycetota bacterium]